MELQFVDENWFGKSVDSKLVQYLADYAIEIRFLPWVYCTKKLRNEIAT